MILYKTDAEVELMKQSARLVSQTLTEVATMLRPELPPSRSTGFALNLYAIIKPFPLFELSRVSFTIYFCE
jgi:hypothetical protein